MTAVRSARFVIAQMNEAMPYTFGDNELNLEEIDLIVRQDAPLVELNTVPADPVSQQIAVNAATIIEDGVLRSYLLNSYSARKLGLETTGNASRGLAGSPGIGPGNFMLQPGDASPEDIIASVDRGLYVTELIGYGVNLVTGDYSRGAVGLWIEKGELTYAVSEVTIGGNLKEMFKQIDMIGSDLDYRSVFVAPTLKIRCMTVAGK